MKDTKIFLKKYRTKKRQYGPGRYKNLSQDEKQKLVKYRKKTSQDEKMSYYNYKNIF